MNEMTPMKRPQTTKRTLYCLALAGSVLLLSSCGKSYEPCYPVSGTITYNGQPLQGATILFYPQGGAAKEKKLFPIATSDQSGNFAVRTYEKENPDGAPVGEYKVCVYYPPGGTNTVDRAGDPVEAGPTSANTRQGKRLSDYIKKNYYNINTTPLTANVAPGSNQPITLDLK